MNKVQKTKTESEVLIIERVFDAPRELVFKAWVDPKDALQWGGPSDWPVIATEGDVRPGGRWRSTLQSVKDGTKLYQGGVYKEIREPECLVFTFAWENLGEENPETLVTLKFEDLSGKTRMTFRQEPFASFENREGHRAGWTSAFDRLDEFLKTNR